MHLFFRNAPNFSIYSAQPTESDRQLGTKTASASLANPTVNSVDEPETLTLIK